MKKSPKYVSAAYLAERTSLTTRWFTRQACEGKIPGAVTGGRTNLWITILGQPLTDSPKMADKSPTRGRRFLSLNYAARPGDGQFTQGRALQTNCSADCGVSAPVSRGWCATKRV